MFVTEWHDANTIRCKILRLFIRLLLWKKFVSYAKHVLFYALYVQVHKLTYNGEAEGLLVPRPGFQTLTQPSLRPSPWEGGKDNGRVQA
jgi:hypothetical protein